MSDNRLIIFDTTLRDGEQSPGASMNLAEKLEVARALKDLGVDVIEAGFPIASPGDFEAVQAKPSRTPNGRASTSSWPPAPSIASSNCTCSATRSSAEPSKASNEPRV